MSRHRKRRRPSDPRTHRKSHNGSIRMKIPRNMRLVKDKDGKMRLVEIINPKLDASAKIRMRKSKKQRPARRTV